jgi:hypothetical protein
VHMRGVDDHPGHGYRKLSVAEGCSAPGHETARVSLSLSLSLSLSSLPTHETGNAGPYDVTVKSADTKASLAGHSAKST